jgi:iron complex outermembrane receptor protein
MTKTFLKLPLYCALFGLSQGVFSDDLATGKSHSPELNKVIVSGGKIERDLQKTITGISVVDSEIIEANNSFDLSDALFLTSNARPNGRDGFTIRGINAEGGPSSDVSTADTAGFVLDGAYLDADLLSTGISMWDIDTIEVFKGPQSTSQGKNSLAGTIVVKSNDPVFDTEGSVRLGYGSDNTQVTSLMFNTALTNDLAVRFAGERYYTDGQVSNKYTGKDDEAKKEHYNGRIKLLFQPSETFSALATIGQDKLERGDERICGTNANKAGVFTCDAKKLEAFRDIEGDYKKRMNYQSLKLQAQLSDAIALTSTTSHSTKTDDDNMDADALAPTTSDYAGAADIGTRVQNEKDNSISQEFRFTFENESIRASAGYFYSQSKEERSYDFLLANSLNQYLPNFYEVTGLLAGLGALPAYPNGYSDTILETNYVDEGSSRETTNHALFMEADWDITEATTLLMGLRLDYEKNRNASGITAQNVNQDDIEAINSNAGAYFNTLTSAATYQAYWQPLGLAAAPSAEQAAGIAQGAYTSFLPYLTAGNIDISGGPGAINFQPGDLNNMLNSLAAGASNTTKKDTTHRVLLPKLGIRHQFTDDIGAGYLISRGYRSGGISLNPTGVQSTAEYDPEFVTNHELSFRSTWLEKSLTANANMYYMEWEDQQVQVIGTNNIYDRYIENAGSSTLKGIELDITYRGQSGLQLFTNAAIAKTRYEDFTSGGKNYKGNQFQNAPEKTMTAGIGFDQGMGFNAFLIANHTGESYLNNENTQKVAAYTVTNLRLGYQADVWKLHGYANNVFNRQAEMYYYTYEDYSGDFTLYGDRSNRIPLRSVGLIAQYDF